MRKSGGFADHDRLKAETRLYATRGLDRFARRPARRWRTGVSLRTCMYVGLCARVRRVIASRPVIRSCQRKRGGKKRGHSHPFTHLISELSGCFMERTEPTSSQTWHEAAFTCMCVPPSGLRSAQLRSACTDSRRDGDLPRTRWMCVPCRHALHHHIATIITPMSVSTRPHCCCPW